MKILYLGPESKIGSYLSSKGQVTTTENLISVEDVSKYNWIISYGYRHILTEDHIKSSENPILNLHISLLPYNRGAHPNYWSWVDNTPKGVTIHAMDCGIDTGDIFIQKEIQFGNNETLLSSYNRLKNEIEYLFINNFNRIIKNILLPEKQKRVGTMHYEKDFPGVESWDIRVNKLNVK